MTTVDRVFELDVIAYGWYVADLGDEAAEWCLRQCFDEDYADAVLAAHNGV
ncbi:hypothetical protein ACWEOE_31705 [Amycolatopsis sp. NPDC004368]